MAGRKIKDPVAASAKSAANSLLAEIWEADAIVADILRKKAEAVADIERRFAPELEKWTSEAAALKEEMMRHLAAHKLALFSSAKLFGNGPMQLSSESVELTNGCIRYAVQTAVRRVRGMLDRLKNFSRPDLIHTTESVDWAKIERLSDKALEALGTGRVSKEIFDYDIKLKR